MRTPTLRPAALVIACSVALLSASCGSIEPSPTGPTPVASPAPDPAPSPAPEPSGPGRLEVTIVPNPVPWSGQPIEGCSRPNTWFYDQVLRNTGGATVTIGDRADYMNGAKVSERSGLGIVLAPGAERRIQTRWCSANATEQNTRTDFFGSDEAGNRINFTGPTVRLLAKP